MHKTMVSRQQTITHSPLQDFYQTQTTQSRWSGLLFPDKLLVFSLLLLMLYGWVMLTSASMPRAGSYGSPFAISLRQGLYMGLGFVIAYAVFMVPSNWWFKHSYRILLVGFGFLLLVLVPGVGREINGAMRWIPLGIVNIQASEFARVCMMIYAAAYLHRYQNQIHKSLWAMLRLLIVLAVFAVLLLKQPDFGATVVIGATVLGMIFLAGVCLVRFVSCSIAVAIVAALVLVAAPYRRARLVSFLDPWEDAFGSGYQLVQSLIAIGRGETLGVGMGESIQKHHYLPEAHTDFIFSIIAEELGLVGVCVLMILFTIVVWRAFVIASNADKVRMRFASCLAYGIGVWLAIQSLINMSVATGILPTKGLTLPMISFGGSSLLASFILFALLLRIDSESRYLLARQGEVTAKNKANNQINRQIDRQIDRSGQGMPND
ncbi:putative lipid II flippase FtsW [Ostreibacterium oceani]|uniref:Probable peptidoglycan glycosyltransferase FtsW n=1 Tax=Ostreibacterium oceani TaxID=2654998 RepID=A0A6N7EUY8_9GAMM|nr:putative lipid II flippase FtsW [Ostreibacterium oceani]MPV86272.1 putative lipid II flippase FtsW [Ostreibacterium oceani]